MAEDLLKLMADFKLKIQWLTHLLEWPKPRTRTPPSADEDVEQQELTLTAGGKAGGAATGWWFLTNLDTGFPYNPETLLHGIYPKELHGCLQQLYA